MKTVDHVLDHVNQAIEHYNAGRFQQAVVHYRQALSQAPASAELHVDLGSALLAVGDVTAARDCFAQAIDLRPDFAEAYYNLGLSQNELGQTEAALDAYRQAIQLKSSLYQAHLNLANLYRQQNDLELALAHYRTVLQLQPNHIKGLISLATLLRSEGRPDEAMPLLARAQQLAPSDPEIYEHMGQTCADLCRFEDTLTCFQQLARLRPDWPPAHCSVGAAWNLLGQYHQAIEHYQKAIALDPHCASARWNRTLLYLLQGRWELGWRDFDQRYHLDIMDRVLPHRYRQPRWDGSPFPEQTLLVHHEQGLGDIIQFIRFLPQVKQRGGRVLLEVPRSILTLVRDWDCIDQAIATQRDRPVQEPFDRVISLMDLPALFHTTEANAAVNVPYLHAQDDKVQTWASHFRDSGFKIGLVWAGGAVDHHRVAALKLRACRLEHLQPLSLIPDVTLYGLQKGPGTAELHQSGNHFLHANLGEQFQDFSDTAAALAHLDLIITVDTSVAHLAGAMGKPTWIMLKFDADWRWLLERSDSPWYPSVRLFRQARNEGWPAVIQRVAQALREQLCR